MRRTAGLFLLLCLVGACKRKDDAPASSAAPPAPTQVDGKTVDVTVVYGSEKKTWLEEEAKAFMATSPKTSDGRPIRIFTQAMGSGEAMQAVLAGRVKPTVFSPASGVYVTLLNQEWLSRDNHQSPSRPPASRSCSLRSSSPCGARWPRRSAGRKRPSAGPTS